MAPFESPMLPILIISDKDLLKDTVSALQAMWSYTACIFSIISEEEVATGLLLHAEEKGREEVMHLFLPDFCMQDL